MHVALLVADGVTDSGVAVALDVLRTANALARRRRRTPPFRLSLVGVKRRLRTASGLELGPIEPLARANDADVILVPGLWVEARREIDALFARRDVVRLVSALREAYRRGATLGSSCGGAFLLAAAGVLDGVTATTTWWLAPELQRRCPKAKVEAARALVVEGRVITAGAVFAQADLVLHLVARVCGPSTSRDVARLLLLDAHASQAAFMAIHHLSVNDELVRRAEIWARAHLAEDFSVEQLARAAGTSSRTLARRLGAAVGTSPLGFVQRLRVEQAVHLIETTSLSLDEVSAQVGYAEANALRRVMRRHVAASPRELRRRAPS